MEAFPVPLWGTCQVATLFDPIRLLKEISNELLCELFTRGGAKLRIPWDDLSQRDVGPIIVLWETMPEIPRRKIHVILQEVHALADERGLRALATELEWHHPELTDEFSVRNGRLDKALWAYLNARDAFDEAAIFARADSLISGRYWNRWNSLPRESIRITNEHTKALQNELRKYYWPKQLRGRHCRVHHYPRSNGVDYFFAYLDDWPDRSLVFDDDGEMAPRSERYAFTNVFAFDHRSGCIDLVAKGGRKVHLVLREAFCRSVLGIDVEDDDPISPAYRLDHLLDPTLALPTEPSDRIAGVRLTRIRMIPKHVVNAVRYEEIGFSQHATLQSAVTELAERLADQNLLPSLLTVKQAGFQLQFQSDGTRKQKTMTFSVSCPNSCDLKSKPDEMREIGERCLKLWGIVDD
jgi:hypothetical protein